MPRLVFGIFEFIQRPSYCARTSIITNIESVKAPVLIVSGTADTLTPTWMATKLFAQANQPKQLYPVTGAGHNDLLILGGVALQQELRKFVREN